MKPEKKKQDDLLRTNYDLDEKVEDLEVKVPIEQEESFAKLSHLEKIKMIATQKGVSASEPNKKCKKCYGRGYVSVSTSVVKVEGEDDIVQETPNVCKCMFSKDDLPKVFSGKVLLGRDARRRHEAKKMKGLSKIRTIITNRKELIEAEEKAKAKKKRLRKLKQKQKRKQRK